MLKEIILKAPSCEGALSICVEVIYSERKTLGLEVTADGRVRARVPRRAGDKKAVDGGELLRLEPA